MAKLLLIEDNKELAEATRQWLDDHDHVVDIALDGDQGEAMMAQFQYEVIIVDWKLPGQSGIELCQKFRDLGKTTPILMLTGKGNIDDKVVGFESGVDDYLTKPFEPAELLARVKALLRRPAAYSGAILQAAGLELELSRRVVRKDGQETMLQRQEFNLLEYLMRHPNQIISTSALLNTGWAIDKELSQDALYTCMARLRKKLKSVGSDALTTMHTQGYMLKD